MWPPLEDCVNFLTASRSRYELETGGGGIGIEGFRRSWGVRWSDSSSWVGPPRVFWDCAQGGEFGFAPWDGGRALSLRRHRVAGDFVDLNRVLFVAVGAGTGLGEVVQPYWRSSKSWREHPYDVCVQSFVTTPRVPYIEARTVSVHGLRGNTRSMMIFFLACNDTCHEDETTPLQEPDPVLAAMYPAVWSPAEQWEAESACHACISSSNLSSDV